jgi:hypothetical protein
VPAHIIDSAFDIGQRLLHSRQQTGTLMGQMHLPAVAAKQRPREVLFERTDLQTGRAGGDSQCIGRSGEVQVLGDRDKHAQAA